jgi:hypothetical protein
VTLRVVLCDAYMSHTEVMSDAALAPQLVQFSYLQNIPVYSVTPLVSFIDGNTRLSITGNGFKASDVYSCQFQFSRGMVETAVTVGTGRSMYCHSPPSTDGAVTSSVSINSKKTEASLFSIPFQYTIRPVFESQNTMVGSEFGGTNVILYSANMSGFGVSSCRFGDAMATSSSSFLMPNTIGWFLSCLTPPAIPSTMDMLVTPNGVDFVSTGFQFTYVTPPGAVSVFPAVISDSTPFVSLNGSNFDAMGTLCCGFDFDVTSAVVLSPEQIQCPIPAAWAGREGGFESVVSLLLNCQETVSTGITVRKLLIPGYVHVQPAMGFPTGGTRVMVSASGVGQGGAGSVVCAFADHWSHADVINDNTALCVSPPLVLTQNQTRMDVPLRISIDSGSSFLALESVFSYVLQPEVDTLLPLVAIGDSKFTALLKGAYFSKPFRGESAHRVFSAHGDH